MESQASPEFSDYLHAIGRRKALLIGIAIPIAALAMLLSLTLPDIYTSSALVEIDAPSSQPMGNATQDGSYADQYVQNLKGIVLTDENLRRLNKEHRLYPQLEGDDSAMLKRLRRDITVQIVTTPILDPRTGRLARIEQPRRGLGRVGSGAVRFGGPARRLGLAEGIETALSASAS